MNEEKHSANVFKPAHHYEKLVVVVLCVAALAGFVFLLMKYAQPTPAGSAFENKQSKQSIAEARMRQMDVNDVTTAVTDPTTASDTSPAASVGSSSVSVASGLQTGKGTITASQAGQLNLGSSAAHAAASQDGTSNVATPAVNKVVDTLQAGLNPVGIHL
jgi:hypothetical protein